MADDSQYPNPRADFNRYLDAPPALAPFDADNLEGETLFYMASALQWMRPSTLLRLAHCAKTQTRMLALLKLAALAKAEPSMAVAFAGDAVDEFDTHEADLADYAYSLIMLCADDNGDNWQKLSDVVHRVVWAGRA